MLAKVVMLGAESVGKSALVQRFANNEFSDKLKATVQASFIDRTVQIKAFQKLTDVSLQIWDTAGQERFSGMMPLYYRGASIAIVVFDVTNYQSLARAKAILHEVKEKAPAAVIALAANKTDTEETFWNVTFEEAEEAAAQRGAIFYKTSAKTGQGVQELFKGLASRFLLGGRVEMPEVDKVDPISEEKKRGQGCC